MRPPRGSIAADAGVAVGLAYRYFEAKEAIVVAFYEQVAKDLATHPIEGDTLGSRFRSVMRTKISLVAHRRRAMGSVLAAMLDPDGPVGMLSPATAEIRQATRGVLRQAVQGSPGLPEHLQEPLVRLGWVGHALLTLAWVQRPDATLELLDKVAWALDRLVPWLSLPQAAAALVAASEALGRFGGDDAVIDRAVIDDPARE